MTVKIDIWICGINKVGGNILLVLDLKTTIVRILYVTIYLVLCWAFPLRHMCFLVIAMT